MAFSIFGKKSQPGGPSAAGGGATRPATPPTIAGGRRIAGVADFFAGGAEPTGRFASRSSRRNGTAGAASNTSSYQYGAEIALNQVESVVAIDSVPPAEIVPAWSPRGDTGPVTEVAFTQLPSQLDMESTPRRRAPLSLGEMPDAIENCAIAYANGQAADALKLIEAAITADDLGGWAQQAWLMRFDLYEHLGLKAAFETEALSFAEKFERSPPVWKAHARAADPLAASIPTVHITGQLSVASSAPLSALRKTVNRYSGVRLDFGRLQGADRDGCRYLLVTLQSLKLGNKTVMLGAPEVLLALLRPNIRPGDSSTDAAMWLLFLEVLQLTDAPDEFERVAIDYATTFEVSPPSWLVPPKAVIAPVKETTSDDRFYFEGELVAPADALLEELRIYADTHSLLVLDMTRLTRIDFVTASQLAHDLGQIQASGRGIEIRSPSELVSSLLVLMGANEVARIVARRS